MFGGAGLFANLALFFSLVTWTLTTVLLIAAIILVTKLIALVDRQNRRS